MKFVALVSGGKDSCYNVLHCLKQGHEMIALANLKPSAENVQELDSYMFQTVGHDLVAYYEQCTGLPLYRRAILQGGSKNVDLNYVKTEQDEIEDLMKLLTEVKKNHENLEAVSVGAILSSYQRTRVEDVCSRLGLVVLSYLWQRNQKELMREMCGVSKQIGNQETGDDCKLDARLIKVAAIGLDESHLAKSLPQMRLHMEKLNSMYEVHICGEGGEYETFVLDAPFFKKGSLELISQTDDLTDKSSLIYNTRLNVRFKPREISNLQLVTELKALPIPDLLNNKWLDLSASIGSPKAKFDSVTTKKTSNQEFSNLVTVTKLSDTICISNLISRNPKQTIFQQTEDVFTQLAEILSEHSISRTQILNSTLLLSDMNNFAQVNKVYNEFFQTSRYGPLPPSRACVASGQIPNTSGLQLSVIAQLLSHDQTTENRSGIEVNNHKDGLHVQGWSYWAPCNIGPYSQAIWSKNDPNKVAFISGQIGLDPSTMKMVVSDRKTQATLSLRHLNSIRETIDAKELLMTTCYITNPSMVPIVTKIWSLYCSEMIEESDYWMYDVPQNKQSLCILQVDQLPRDAVCEWSAIACEKVFVQNGDTSDLSYQATSNSTEVYSEGKQRTFTTLFFNSLDDLMQIVKDKGPNAHFTLFCNQLDLPEELITQITQLKKIEYQFVNSVFNFEGFRTLFALRIIA